MALSGGDAVTETQQEYVDCIKGWLGGFVCIPVHNELGIPLCISGKRTKIQFAFRNWNTAFPYQFFLNDGKDAQIELKEDVDYTLSPTNGSILLRVDPGSTFATGGTYDGELVPGTEIEGTYRFNYFTDEEIRDFAAWALHLYNASGRPTTNFTLDNAPGEAVAAILSGGYWRALQRILLDSNLWNNRFIWADLQGSMSYLQSTIQSLSVAEDKNFNKAIDNKPRSFVKPRGVTSAHRTMQQQVTAANALGFVTGFLP